MKVATQVHTLCTKKKVIAAVCYKVKSVGKPDAVIPHVRFDVEGAGNVATVEL